MSRAVLDTGALIAVDKGDRRVAAMLRVLQRERVPIVTSAGSVAQAWRDGARQAPLARVLAGVEERSLDGRSARRAGELLGRTSTRDVVDAHVAGLCHDGDRVLTSDVGDLEPLVRARGVEVVWVAV